jgi:outer membrane lipoprotein-sorting protein
MLRRPIALLALVVAVLAAGAAIAVAALNGPAATPPAKPLAVAIRDAVNAPASAGVTARIRFTNRLVDQSSVGGSSPLLAGATGRLWAAGGRVRLELQSDNGDAQVSSDGRTVTIFDATQNQAYRITLPSDSHPSGHGDAPLGLGRIERLLKGLTGQADVSGARPSNVAGREAYTVRVGPKHDGGLIGAAELAWDAANGTPLRAAVYAAGNPEPVLELEATDISFGKVSATDLSAPVPAGTRVTDVDLAGRAAALHGKGPHAAASNDPKAVAAQLPFALSAPNTLVGLPRGSVRAITSGSRKGALVTYGAGLGGIVVLEQPADAAAGAPAKGGDQRIQLPKVSIDGTDGQELATTLGTVVRFARGGVQYTLLGSVPPAAAEAAARAL